MKKLNVKTIVLVGLLSALHIVLSRFFSFNAWNTKIGFSFVPVFVAACLCGPLAAALVGGLGDFLGAVLFPIGPYFPGFTLTCALTGLTFALLLHKKQTIPRILGAVAINQLVIGLLINSFWLSILFRAPYWPTLFSRVVQCAILAPVEFVTISFLSRALNRYRREGLA